MENLEARVAVVTGAARGIGLGIARALAAEGAQVVLSDLPSDTLAEEAERLVAEGRQAVALPSDVRDPSAVDALAQAVLERFGAVHLLCNNAGVMGRGLAWEITLEDWHRVLDVNLWGVVHGVRSFLPLLLEAPGGGHVVNVASMAAVTPVASIAPYNVSKHGVLALSETLMADLASIGADVGVTVVMPARVATALGRRPPGEGAGEDPPEEGSGVLKPDAVGRAVVQAVRENRPFLFTHEHSPPQAEARFRRILGA